MPRRSSTLKQCAAGLAVLAVTSTANATEPKKVSTGAEGARWRQGVIELIVDETLEAMHPHAFEAVVYAVSEWQVKARGLPTLVVRRGDGLNMGYKKTGNNQNVVRFARDGEPRAKGALAITVLTYNSDSGEILDADIVMNGEHLFGDAGAGEVHTFDVQNVLTHEIGHFLGLGEDYAATGATMYAYSQPGEVAKRDLDPIDVADVEALYGSSDEFGCGGATMSGRTTRDSGWLASVVALGLIGALSRRRALRAIAGSGFIGVLCLAGTFDEHARLHSSEQALQAHVSGTVVLSDATWQGGMVVTELELADMKCRGAADLCAGLGNKVQVLGGQVEGIVQVVGHGLPPGRGERASLEYSSGSGSVALVAR